MKIGILGGGQLGRMFIQEALKYDDEFYVLDPNPECSCANISHFTRGDFNDYDTVLEFGRGSIAGYVTDDKFQKRQKDRT